MRETVGDYGTQHSKIYVHRCFSLLMSYITSSVNVTNQYSLHAPVQTYICIETHMRIYHNTHITEIARMLCDVFL